MSRGIFYFVILMISIKVYGISPSPYSNNDINITIKTICCVFILIRKIFQVIIC